MCCRPPLPVQTAVLTCRVSVTANSKAEPDIMLHCISACESCRVSCWICIMWVCPAAGSQAVCKV